MCSTTASSTVTSRVAFRPLSDVSGTAIQNSNIAVPAGRVTAWEMLAVWPAVSEPPNQAKLVPLCGSTSSGRLPQ